MVNEVTLYPGPIPTGPIHPKCRIHVTVIDTSGKEVIKTEVGLLDPFSSFSNLVCRAMMSDDVVMKLADGRVMPKDETVFLVALDPARPKQVRLEIGPIPDGYIEPCSRVEVKALDISVTPEKEVLAQQLNPFESLSRFNSLVCSAMRCDSILLVLEETDMGTRESGFRVISDETETPLIVAFSPHRPRQVVMQVGPIPDGAIPDGFLTDVTVYDMIGIEIISRKLDPFRPIINFANLVCRAMRCNDVLLTLSDGRLVPLKNADPCCHPDDDELALIVALDPLRPRQVVMQAAPIPDSGRGPVDTTVIDMSGKEVPLPKYGGVEQKFDANDALSDVHYTIAHAMRCDDVGILLLLPDGRVLPNSGLLLKCALDPAPLQISEELDSDPVLEAFQSWDSDGNGEISLEELCAVMVELNPEEFTLENTQMVFEAADCNKDGKLNLAEFAKWMRS